ncbi:hypothetical protein [Cellulomonas pakistanensis]|uniref:Uncharacterized protein n=1 Tax=Cellulomonas pakistanensis TaxID=992287 RepID=A0A919PBD9_9CELL|nr:hypothetical protein [Cellulomonas pakistanensis]GIG36558.1 hypothetical protein Cpa01nite_19390 [Cellulomonas pakistanensis]
MHDPTVGATPATTAAYDRRTALLADTPSVMSRPGWETITVLVAVKAYPVIGSRTGESVCVAGTRLDEPVPEWVRLFPVGFRELPRARQFRKYDVIRLRARRQGGNDRRPETFRPDLDSLELGPHVDTDGGTWQSRAELLGGLRGATTTCELARRARAAGQDAPSLGLVRPRVHDLVIRDNPEYRPGGAPRVDADLFGEEREVLEKTPFVATYHYICADDPDCRGHRQSVVDRESGQLARSNIASMGREAAREAHRRRFLDEMCAPGRDTHFYVGNQHQHPASFLVLGLFWPRGHVQPTFALDV